MQQYFDFYFIRNLLHSIDPARISDMNSRIKPLADLIVLMKRMTECVD